MDDYDGPIYHGVEVDDNFEGAIYHVKLVGGGGGGGTKVNTTITLTAAGWSNGSQTVSVSGITSTGVVFVSPDPTDQADYTTAGILCTSQATDLLEFTCTNTPTNDIDVVVVML